MIPLLTLRDGDGPLLHLAPANGFPPGAYRGLAAALDGCRVVALLPRPLWPGSRPESISSWRPLADDLVAGLDAHGLSGLVGVGHSLGGVLTMWAAIQRPDLFRAVVLIDPVLLPPAFLFVARLLRALGQGSRLPLVQGALRRRRTWPDRDVCFAHLRAKSLFDRWTDTALWDYVEAGTRPGLDGQVELAYPPEWEARIFATVPADVWSDVPHLHPPALVIRGEHSDTFRPEALALVARLLPGARTLTLPASGHLAPMEDPAQVAEAILAFIRQT